MQKVENQQKKKVPKITEEEYLQYVTSLKAADENAGKQPRLSPIIPPDRQGQS